MSSSNSADAAAAALLTGVGAIFYLIMLVFSIAVSVIMIIAMWKLFVKAGEAGWASIIPFYNIWVLCKIAFNSNILWFVLFLIPATSGIAAVVSYFALAKSFGKGPGFGVLMIFLPYIGFPLLAFSSAEYTGDKL